MRVFPLTSCVFVFSGVRNIHSKEGIPKSPNFIVSVEMEGQIRQIFLRIRKYTGEWKRGLTRVLANMEKNFNTENNFTFGINIS